jgi:hypothetical protein
VEQAAGFDVETAEIFLKVLTELRPRGVVENAVAVVGAALADITRYGGLMDLLCPSRLFAELAFAGNADPRHAVRLDQLAEIDVPRLDHLLVEDAVHIRQGSGPFARWRHDLSIGLERARDLRATAGPNVDATQVVAEVLDAARQAIAGEVSGSRVLGGSQAVVSFVAGGLGGALGGAAGGVAGAVLGAAGGVVGPLAQSHLVPGGLAGFLDRHYVLFERPRTSD